jgi:peptidoglycan/LPS O-acetylase OafA/YrhL
MNQLVTSNVNKLHLRYLDGLRGIASFYVLLVHIEPSVGDKLPALLELFIKTLKEKL